MQPGENIARLRRQAGLTQEQLGSRVSVSAQAVCKWEKGGMPDSELLPAIADALGVTIDTLFGREYAKSMDMNELFFKWYTGKAEDKRQYELFKLLLMTQTSPIKADGGDYSQERDKLSTLPLKTANGSYTENGENVPVWLRSQMTDDFGMRLSIPAEDCPLYMVMPEPAGGYRSNMLEAQDYQKLFAALAMDGSMELLFFLYSNTVEYYSVAALAKACNIEESSVIAALDAMYEFKLINRRTVVDTDGKRGIYALNENPGIVPLLLFARWITVGPGFWWSWTTRTKPLFG